MSRAQEAQLRKKIRKLLGSGLRTRTSPFPETHREFGLLLEELRELDEDDLKGKLVLAGMLDHPSGLGRQRCQECMYYLVHRKWCDLPEVSLPVEADWWCRLWHM